jgi:hypothetical protein
MELVYSGLHTDVDVLIHARGYISVRAKFLAKTETSSRRSTQRALFCVHIDNIAYVYAFTYAQCTCISQGIHVRVACVGAFSG